MVRGHRHRGEPEAVEVDAGEGHGGEIGETDLGEAPARLEPAGGAHPAIDQTRAADPGDRDAEERGIGGEPVGQLRRASIQAQVGGHGSSRHDAPRLRARLTSIPARRFPNAVRISSARACARASLSTSANTVGPQEL